MDAGAVAGAAGVTAMTAAEKVEQAVTGRPGSHVPGRGLSRLLGLADPPQSQLNRVNIASHVGMAVGVGTVRGIMAFAGLFGPWASAMFTVLRLSADQTVEKLDGCRRAAMDLAARRVGDRRGAQGRVRVRGGCGGRRARGGYRRLPGQKHAQLARSRARDVGPVPGRRMYRS